MYTTFVGIDISKESFDFSILSSNFPTKSKKLLMNSSGFASLLKIISAFDKTNTFIVMESTGTYHFNLLDFLLNNSFSVAVVNPFLVKSFINSCSVRKTKTDSKDAYSIACFAKEKVNSLRPFVKSEFSSLKTLVRTRESLTNDISNYKTKITELLNLSFPELQYITPDLFAKSILSILSSAPSAHAIHEKGLEFLKSILSDSTVHVTPDSIFSAASNSISCFDSYLDENIKILIEILEKIVAARHNTEQLIKNIYASNENLKANVQIISSISGIKDISAVCILSETNIFNKNILTVFPNYKKLIAFFGTDPSVRQSGTSVSGRGCISKRGNAILRKKARNLAFCIYQRNPIFNEYYNKKRNEGKSHNEALIALWNKVLRIIFHLLAFKTTFDPNHCILKAESGKSFVRSTALTDSA